MSQTLHRVLRHLLSQGEPQPKEPAGEEIGAAFAHRAIGLTAWLRGDDSDSRMESEMLLSAELFLAQGNLHETAVSRALLGFYLAERSPALALACVQAGLDEMDDGFWLRPFAEVVKAECLLTLEQRGKPRLQLQELRYSETSDAPGDLRLHWLAWRSCSRLGDPVAAVALASIGMCFLGDRQYEEAILCTSDLIELAAMLPGDEVSWWLAGQLLEACEDRVALSGPFGTAMSALCWLRRTAGQPRCPGGAVVPCYRGQAKWPLGTLALMLAGRTPVTLDQLEALSEILSVRVFDLMLEVYGPRFEDNSAGKVLRSIAKHDPGIGRDLIDWREAQCPDLFAVRS